MKKPRLDTELVNRQLVSTRSQAENYIKLGKVSVDGQVITKSGYLVSKSSAIELHQDIQYVSRAALKLASAAPKLGLNFKGKTVLDVGSSTGGFTDYALKHGAKKVIAVDVGSNQLHPSLRGDSRVELHEQIDIRELNSLSTKVDIALIDVSFISLKKVLPAVEKLLDKQTQIVALLKPQFEAGESDKNKGVIKNDTVRRHILKDFEDWAKKLFNVANKTDSEITGVKGNRERFYLLNLKT